MEAKAAEKTKRELILEAAMVVFAREGFYKAKVEDIAIEAGVGKGTVYEYFSSKAELFKEMFKEGMEKFIRTLHGEVIQASTAREKLKKIAYLHYDFIMKNRDLAKITMESQNQCDDDFRKWLFGFQNQKMDFIKSIIEEGIAKGEFRQVDSRAASLAFTGAMGSLFAPVTFGKLDIKPEEIIEPILKVLFEGMSK
ncbi:MAG: TetR/AcrR family transcriptional regulator [Clostridia bacterium]|nr:TetR/AcrR family transcriptional regulator [Clostridia bacterium]